MQIIEQAKLLLGINDNSKDDVLSVYVNIIEDEVKEYCSIDNDAALLVSDSLIVKMLVYKYNRQGTENLSSYNYSGVSESFINGYSRDIINSLDSYKRKNRRIKTI